MLLKQHLRQAVSSDSELLARMELSREIATFAAGYEKYQLAAISVVFQDRRLHLRRRMGHDKHY